MLAPSLAALLLAQAAPAAVPEDLTFATAAEDRMTVAVTVADRGPYAFIVDTGAERTVVSRELVASLALRPGPAASVLAMTGSARVDTAVVPALAVGSVAGRDLTAPVLERRNLGALGILGLDLLQGRTVAIDFERQVMRVTPSPPRRRAERHAPDEIVVTGRNLFGQLVVTDARFRGRRIRVVLDTGSVATVGNAAFRRLAERGSTPAGTVQLISVTGAALDAEQVQVDALEIGGIRLAGLPIAFAEAAPFARFGLSRRPALLLGMDTLRQFRQVEIDFANRQVRFLLPRDAGRAAD